MEVQPVEVEVVIDSEIFADVINVIQPLLIEQNQLIAQGNQMTAQLLAVSLTLLGTSAAVAVILVLYKFVKQFY